MTMLVTPTQPLPDVQVTHGANDGVFCVAGKTVASVRRGLATVFSISTEAEAFVGGSVVAAGYTLRAGDWLEFLRRRGRKQVGDLLTPEQLIQRWHITEEQYQQLLKAGLPTIRFEDGSVRHPEVAVDEWMRCRYTADPDTTCIDTDIKWIAGQRVYTVKEAAEVYFQGRISQRELYNLFDKGELLGFRVGKKTILIYESSLDTYRLTHENKKPPVPQQEPVAPIPPQPPKKRRRTTDDLPPIRLKSIPSP
jgi:hypothetical protein